MSETTKEQEGPFKPLSRRIVQVVGVRCDDNDERFGVILALDSDGVLWSGVWNAFDAEWFPVPALPNYAETPRAN